MTVPLYGLGAKPSSLTQEEIIRMAEEAGLAFGSDEYPDIWQTYMHVGRDEIKRFAALVAAHERAACAKVCEERQRFGIDKDGYMIDCAAAIRARSNHG